MAPNCLTHPSHNAPHSLVSTIASFMMNGVCCVWQMQEEEERRDAIRKDIRVECERQRIIEREVYEQRKIQELVLAREKSIQEERRRRLMMTKLTCSSESVISNTAVSNCVFSMDANEAALASFAEAQNRRRHDHRRAWSQDSGNSSICSSSPISFPAVDSDVGVIVDIPIE